MYVYTVVIKKVVPSKYCNISVTWVISMHQRAWCSFIQMSIMYCKETVLTIVKPDHIQMIRDDELSINITFYGGSNDQVKLHHAR